MSNILKGLQLNELSNEKLGQYKKAAGADAKKADSEGDYKRGDKRMSGIIKATKKEFANDEKKVDEAFNNYHANRTGFTRPKRDLSGEGEPQGMFMVMIDGRPWKEFTSNVAFARAKTLADKNPTKKIQVRWPTGQLNTVSEEKIKGADGKACWKGKRYAGTVNGKDKCIPVKESAILKGLK